MKRISLCVSILLAGCANLQADSSALIGCPPEEVKISNQKMGMETNTWTAECRGQTFICSRRTGGANTCSKALPKNDAR